MRRRHVHQPCVRRQPVNRRTAVGDGQCAQRRAVREKELPRARITRLLDRGLVAGIEQQPRAQVECLLRSVDDDHLIGIAADGPRPAEIGDDRLAECACPGGMRAVIEDVRRALASGGGR